MAVHTGWVVVEFIGDQSVSEIPTDWVIGKMCYWPPYKPSLTTVAIKNCEHPDESWEKLPVSIFPGGIYYDYATARAKARKAEETSDLQSDVEATKRKIIRKRCSSSEESGPDHTPQMSPLPGMKKVIEDSTSLLPPPPKMRKLLIRSDETVPASIQSPSTSYGSQEGNFSSMNIEIENIDAGPSGSTSIVEALAKINAKLSTLINQTNVQRTLMLDVMQRMAALENQKQAPPPPPVADQSFLSKFSYLQFPLASTEKLKELEEVLKDPKNFQDAVNDFASFGGSDAYDFIKRVLGSILTNEVTIKYSWLGRRSKEAFANLTLASAVIYAAEKAKVTDNKKKCEGAIQLWLKRASDRQLAAEKKTYPGID